MAGGENTPLTSGVAEPSSSEGRELGTCDKCLMYMIHLLRLVAALTSVAMVIAQALTLVMLNEAFLQDVLRFYIFCFCGCFILVELHDWFQDQIPFFAGWIHRGIMYSFIGVIGVEESVTVKISKNERTNDLNVSFLGRISGDYVYIVSVVMFAVGLLYLLLGALCLRSRYDEMRQKESASEETTEKKERK